jgi:hypothetical protein
LLFQSSAQAVKIAGVMLKMDGLCNGVHIVRSKVNTASAIHRNNLSGNVGRII